MQDHRNLTIWREGIELAKLFYSLTSNFPKSENEILVHQIRKAVIAIPSNIAAGVSKGSDKDFYAFLENALSFAYELDTYLLLSFELNYLDSKDYDKLLQKLNEEREMIHFFMGKLQG